MAASTRPGCRRSWPRRLFHLGDDPYEQNDLAASDPDHVRAMQQELDRWFESVEADRRGIPEAPE
jgi:hypothetical protein